MESITVKSLSETIDSLEEIAREEDDGGELVEYVERERDLQRRREERQDAPAWTHAKWWLFGRDRDREGSE